MFGPKAVPKTIFRIKSKARNKKHQKTLDQKEKGPIENPWKPRKVNINPKKRTIEHPKKTAKSQVQH